MLKETNSIAEYKTPKCKVVNIFVQNSILSASQGTIPNDGDLTDDDETNY